MGKRILGVVGAVVVVVAAPGPAQATGAFALADFHDVITREAWNRVLNLSATAAFADEGDAQFFAQMPRHSGVAGLIMDHGPLQPDACSDVPSADRRSLPVATRCPSEDPDTP